MTQSILQHGFDTNPIEMQPMLLLTFQASFFPLEESSIPSEEEMMNSVTGL